MLWIRFWIFKFDMLRLRINNSEIGGSSPPRAMEAEVFKSMI